MMPRSNLGLLLTVAWLVCEFSPTARAEVRTYILAIGNNQLPSDIDADGEVLRRLRYADDDAGAFLSLARELGYHGTLLTVLDADSQRRFPELVRAAQLPTLAELRRSLVWHRNRFEADRRAGHEPVLLFFFSGHGTASGDTDPALAMLDGSLTQEVLYNEVLSVLPARFVHLIVDACHAEAVVRPRDAQAPIANIHEADRRIYAAHSTLSRFPHVGALMASASTTQTHEWEAYRQGVFTHEVLSGLRGAADVNGDGRIEYSEIFAFLGAANGNVTDPRARLVVVAKPPAMDRRAALVDLKTVRRPRLLVGNASVLGSFHVEDDRGNRLADMRAEPGLGVKLVFPSDRTLYLRTRYGEAEIRSGDGAPVVLDRMILRPLSLVSRGALDTALRRGLFATAFGPTYYRGFVDGREEILPVPVVVTEEHKIDAVASDRNLRRQTWISVGVTSALGATAAIFAGLALQARDDLDNTNLERPATEAHERFVRNRAVALSAGAGALVTAGVGVWLRLRAPSVTSTRSTLTMSVLGTNPGIQLTW